MLEFICSIKIIRRNGRVALINTDNSRQYLLLTEDRFDKLLHEMTLSDPAPPPSLIGRLNVHGWFVSSSDEHVTREIRAIPHCLIELTSNCNARCTHCYRDSSYGSPSGEISYDQFDAYVLPFLHLAGARIVGLTGGEPTIAADFKVILDRLLGSTCFDLVLYTNALYMPSEIVSSIVEYNDRVGVQVSLDGASEGTNDSIRGNGTYRRIISTLRTLQLARMRKVSVKMTLMPENAGEFPDFCDLVRGFGFKPTVSLYKRSGRAVRAGCGYGEALKALDRAFTGRSGFLDGREMDDPYLLFSLTACGLGRKRSLAIDPQLNLLDCVSMRHLLGNIREDPERALDSFFGT